MQKVFAKKDATNCISRLLNSEEVSELLGVKTGTLSYWRCTGRYALPYVRVGRLIMYRPEDIEKFIERRTVTAKGAKG